ncbi:hypothetical protein H5410_009182 [Solanum commersonii]|uniref:Uncharacterized protein n=1 Tax=Solanum commersonii TaxID=4109 RepID=A0A9J6AI00_SOLCO|nr:hypothetical protein H5410_009182 [Solanum commersonii]
MNEVACKRIPIVDTASAALKRTPDNKIINSYHHHSKHTEIQLGTARIKIGFHPSKHSVDQPCQDFL